MWYKAYLFCFIILENGESFIEPSNDASPSFRAQLDDVQSAHRPPGWFLNARIKKNVYAQVNDLKKL